MLVILLISSLNIEVVMEINNSTLIIGPPKSGKTTFQAQLYARILAKKGRIKLTKAPKNIIGLESACKRLADGKETETTAADENLEIVIPVSLDGKEFDLVCKDYGGEQIRNITELMEYDQNWSDRARANDRWILFIRPGMLYHSYDLSKTGYAESDDDKTNNPANNDLSDQYHFIELLQALLYARGSGIKSRIIAPKLLVVLTCWDELKTTDSPDKVLLSKMPLFHHFINSIWKQDSYKIIGLSSQGFPLDNPEAEDKYIDELPESFGYLVLDDNPEEHDLTKLIELALSL